MINAARNDYDLRRTLEAAAMSGKGKAQKLLDKGFKNAGDITKAMNFSEKAAKRHGQGGDFSSASDYMGLTQSMVERDRAKQTAAYDKQYATKDELADVKSAEEQVNEAQAATYEPSDQLKAARDRVANYKQGGSIAGDGDEQRNEAASSFAKYKLNLKRDKNIGPTLPNNPD